MRYNVMISIDFPPLRLDSLSLCEMAQNHGTKVPTNHPKTDSSITTVIPQLIDLIGSCAKAPSRLLFV